MANIEKTKWRLSNDDENAQHKRLRLPEESNNPMEVPEVQNDGQNQAQPDEQNEENLLVLTDLNEYCLESICEYLSIGDLLNLAESDELFFKEVRRATKRIIRDNIVKIGPSSISITDFNDMILDEIRIDNVDESLILKVSKFVKYFGNLIPKLAISRFEWDYGSPNIAFYRIFTRYILKYCSKTLIELDLHNMFMGNPFNPAESILMSIPSKPFESLQILKIGEEHSVNAVNGVNIRFFNEWFPSLQSLSIY